MDKMLIRKSGGFYAVYDDDTYILNYFFGYKIKEDRVGFPINFINKVINMLEDNHISYEIKNEVYVDFNNRNNYKKFIDIGKKKYNLRYRVESIIDNIDKLDEKDIDKILDYIEGVYE